LAHTKQGEHLDSGDGASNNSYRDRNQRRITRKESGRTALAQLDLAEFAVPAGVYLIPNSAGSGDGEDDGEENDEAADAMFALKVFFVVGAGFGL
jgi:hypothetical protein